MAIFAPFLSVLSFACPRSAKLCPQALSGFTKSNTTVYRHRVERDGDRVRLITREGYDWTKRFPWIAEVSGTETGVGDWLIETSSRERCSMDTDRVAGAAKDFAGKIESTVGDIAGDAKTEAAGRTREATGTAQNLYGQAKDAARDASDAAVSYAKDAYENSGDTFRDGSQAIARKVQESPLSAMLIAGGIGFALALLMSRQPRVPVRSRYFG
jgi:uncharacterized protein YjbJ (UPF0337 family)